MHTHAWRVIQCLLLTPPAGGYGERYLEWRCQGCGEVYGVTGEFKLGMPLQDPAYWEGYRAWEQQQRTPRALQAQREQQHRIGKQRRSRRW